MAQQKHGEWKVKLRRAITKHELMDVKTIARDDCCDFGKWLHGDGKIKLGHQTSFSECLSRHAAFHVEAGKVAEVINAQRYKDAEAMLGAGTPYTLASNQVGIAIMRLKQDVNSSSGNAQKPPANDQWEEF
ncbi:MAG: CZB domain-containing protein [Methylobacter sp.]|nr:CZB domain-containing protein [Methylobacter sp.]